MGFTTSEILRHQQHHAEGRTRFHYRRQTRMTVRVPEQPDTIDSPAISRDNSRFE